MQERQSDIKINKGNLYISLTIVISLLTATFLSGYNIAVIQTDFDNHIKDPYHVGAQKVFVPRTELEQILKRMEENYLDIKVELEKINTKIDKNH